MRNALWVTNRRQWEWHCAVLPSLTIVRCCRECVCTVQRERRFGTASALEIRVCLSNCSFSTIIWLSRDWTEVVTIGEMLVNSENYGTAMHARNASRAVISCLWHMPLCDTSVSAPCHWAPRGNYDTCMNMPWSCEPIWACLQMGSI